jgi:Cytochrome P460
MMRDRTHLGTCVLTALVALASVPFASPVAGQTATAPQYEGNLLRMPVGFETWVFVGSNLGMSYKPELPTMTSLEATRAAEQQLFHNVYINPEAYTHFAATREFPEPTILVMEIYTAADKEPKGVLATGVFNSERVGLEVAVKNSRRPDGGTPWAYYTFISPSVPSIVRNPARAHPPEDRCESCHKAHASTDNVWVQFYPILRRFVR